ncbi:uncharacterized protein Pyn_30104 [Prunus yedoensis var. nudiflora]|uniref:Uncharacterized protein n=1 Tax=Prunus yedoensis var. nudiflora TaxID=2094558 RepID=A0A314XR62_PRUYE|nr:uncharacterized protein Pyn_03488 [Prunus yedoensis var. nudiflora]PQP96029.1 uncharacterized protein Pyn_30104 [Prunus yedoensis var. nudiflora]
MTAETVAGTRCKNVPEEGQPLSGEKLQDTRTFGKPSENKFPSGISSEKHWPEDGQIQGKLLERQLLAGISLPF